MKIDKDDLIKIIFEIFSLCLGYWLKLFSLREIKKIYILLLR